MGKFKDSLIEKSANAETNSPLDVKYFKSNLPHLICFPHESIIRCWYMTSDYKKTKEMKISLKIKSK